MKILFLMNGNFSGHSTSEHLLEAILERLVEDGNQVHLVQMKKQDEELRLPDSLLGKDVTTESVTVVPQKKNNFVSRYLNANKNYLNCRSAIRNHMDSDAVFLQSTNAAGMAVYMVRKYLKEATITYNVQDIFPYNASFSGNLKKDGFVFRILAAIQRYGYKHSDHVITISEDMKDTLVCDGVDKSKIEVVYNWSYQDKLYEDVDLSPVSHMFIPEYFNVVYAGNIGVMQNVDILIEAARLMKEDWGVWFHIIGNGVYKDKLETRAKEYGIVNISFWPMQSPEFAPAIYSAADVNVIPLVKDVYRTALPSKTATCLACKRPIIFAIGKESKFAKEVMSETGCPVVESDDAKELVDAIKSIRDGIVLIHTGKYFSQNFRATDNSRKYAEIITENTND